MLVSLVDLAVDQPMLLMRTQCCHHVSSLVAMSGGRSDAPASRTSRCCCCCLQGGRGRREQQHAATLWWPVPVRRQTDCFVLPHLAPRAYTVRDRATKGREGATRPGACARRAWSCMDWEAKTRSNAESASARCDDRAAEAPRVAFCVTGAARSFATPLVLTMLRHNLFGALGAAEGSRFFLQLKRYDSDKLSVKSSTNFPRHNETTVAHLRGALATPWLHRVTAEAIIVDGSGATSIDATGSDEREMQHQGGHHSTVIAASRDQLWQQYRASQCTAAGPAPCCEVGDYLREANNQERMLLHHLGIGWCRASISRYESRSGRAFDMVVYTRPDLVWWKPMLPWCELPWRTQIIACNEPGCDMAWIAPRQASTLLMSTAEQHRDCREPACCANSERLLRHAQARASSLLGVTVNTTIGNALLHSQDRHNGPGAIKKAADQPASLLRYVNGVCRIAFRPAFSEDALPNRSTKDAFKWIPQRGLPISTIASLRRTMDENESACMSALEWTH